MMTVTVGGKGWSDSDDLFNLKVMMPVCTYSIKKKVNYQIRKIPAVAGSNRGKEVVQEEILQE